MRTTRQLAVAALATSAVATPVVESRQAGGSIDCAPIPSPFPSWSQYPVQSSLPDPFLPLKYTTTDNAAGSSTFAKDIMAGKGQGRVKTPEEWYKCRQPEILQLLQEYQYGYYPDHSQEKVEATRSGNTVNIAVTAGGKTGKFKATLSLPSGASTSKRAPVVINIGGMQNAPYLNAGIAVVGFDYTSVAADSNSKTGAFWDLIAAAIAPRALVIDQGTGDQFTDSKGTAIVAYPAAKVVYDWLGVGDKIGMSVRGGGHCDMSGFSSILPFVQKVFFGTATTKNYNDLGTYKSPMTTAFPWATAVPIPKL